MTQNRQHSDLGHALLSPSGWKMYLTCTPSARLAEHMPDVKTTFSKEGELAHELSELLIPHLLGWTTESQYKKQRKDKKKEEKYRLWAPEMDDYVEAYSRYVVGTYSRMLNEDPDAKIYLEEKIDLSEWAPMSYGRLDVHIFTHSTLYIIDYKHGKGVPVDAEDNYQLKGYALGVLSKYHNLTHFFTKVILVVYQPRIDNISEWETTPDDLLDWGHNFVKPQAIKAFKGIGEFAPGPDTCRWCRVKGTCRALAEYNLELARLEFADPPLLTMDEVAEVLGKIDLLTKWAEAVKKHAFKLALQGEEVPGHKLIYGRSNRQYVNGSGVIRALLDKGFKMKQITERNLLPITRMQERIGKTDFNTILEVNGLIRKPDGAPTLVPISKKGVTFVPMADGATEFAEIDENDYTD